MTAFRKPWGTRLPGATPLRPSRSLRESGNEEPPLRSELFSADQMEQHGKALAASHTLAPGPSPDSLLSRLAANETALISVCRLLTEGAAAKKRTPPAGEWLLDNFHLIEEQIRTAKRHLPKGYSRELPRLAQGSSAGHPRVYDIAIEIVAHGDGRLDAVSLRRFVAAYQTVKDLTLGELWAIPIMLRLAVIENLRRVAVRVAAAWTDRGLAGAWADEMTETAETDPKSLILVIADMARSQPPMMGGFVAELARRLQGRGPALALPLTWIEQRLAEDGRTIEQLVQSESQEQAASQVSVSHSIASLRILGAVDWRAFVEDMSVVERILLEDPAGVYAAMDFATRDRYRHATEEIARAGGLTEAEVAHKALALARTGAARDRAGPRDHVGFYLIAQGRLELERATSLPRNPLIALRRMADRASLVLYIGTIVGITGVLAFGVLQRAPALGLTDWALSLLVILSLLPASQLAVSLANWLATLLVTPTLLPRMDFSKGIEANSRTLVVVPTMLVSEPNVEELVEALEVRYLANRDRCLHFALLTDVRDAAEETLPEDASLTGLAQMRIEELNRKHAGWNGRPSEDIFFLFHRPRRWNPHEGVFMGYERKRGKLEALNALLRGRSAVPLENGFSLVVGEVRVLLGVKYVITLDTDTELPRDSAREFAGAMAHPLNRPTYDEKKGRITSGYGILQPRVTASMPGAYRSWYARLNAGDPGIDPYTRAASDVYQDLFGEGSFIGKGIYDVDAFEQALSGRLPENRILSHDLLEGCYARAGLLSDVQLYEEYPARYGADVSRRHRWIRGDWQIASWLRGSLLGARKPGASAGRGPRRKNPLSSLSQWKLFDNLRRSLVPGVLTLWLVLGWTLSSSPSWFFTAFAAGLLMIPALLAFVYETAFKAEDALFRQHFVATTRSARIRTAQAAFQMACLPHEAAYSLDAIARTAWRMLFSKRRLLEWNPSAQSERRRGEADGELASSLKSMWMGPAIALAVAVALFARGDGALPPALPILLLWFTSPVLAWWISRPLVRREGILTSDQGAFLRQIARRTWGYFDTFVGPEDHWLPPDNVQASRLEAVAHRTSPTNMGLSLLANLSAYDFGFIPVGQVLHRTEKALRTMSGLERHRGHLYNWYDTRSLQPLPPLYVSSVDSGNLAGHLLTLRAGLEGLVDDPIVPPRVFDGLLDTVRILEDEIEGPGPGALAEFRRILEPATVRPVLTIPEASTHLKLLVEAADELVLRVMETQEPSTGALEFGVPQGEAVWWARALARQCHESLDDLIFMAPWLSMGASPFDDADLAPVLSMPTLRSLSGADTDLKPTFARRLSTARAPEERAWLVELQRRVAEGSGRARDRRAALGVLLLKCDERATMEYGFLFDKARSLLSIGYNVAERRTDRSSYDLLASEARLCSFVAIAQEQLPQESWFALGRLLTSTSEGPVLLSWSGSMFEYLMPLLVMPSYEGTLLDQTCRAAVARQIEYGRERGVPWGISESAYNTVDAQLNFQYRAFGVPGLGLKRGLADDLVIAPYASALALMVRPEEACANLQQLAGLGVVSRFGFFEAIDYTKARQPRGKSHTVVHSFMAHHQGMVLLAIGHTLLHRPMQRRFASDRRFQATLLLLQERVPKATAFFSLTAQAEGLRSAARGGEAPVRQFTTPNTPSPQVQLLSNGRYHVMVTNGGGGYSKLKDLSITRWREDVTCDPWGTFCYIRELGSGAFWSSAYQPSRVSPEAYEVTFSEGRAEFRRRDTTANGHFDTHTEIVVSPEDDIELRRIKITNHSRQRRQIDVTSYAEVVLAPEAPDAMHPAFSNLFVETEIVRERRAILCARRPRSLGEQTPSMFHLMAVHGSEVRADSYETDRARFLGRTGSTASPLAMKEMAPLSDTSGSVLDPVVAIRCAFAIEPGETAIVDLVSGIAPTRELAMGLIGKYQDRHLADRVFELSWTHSQVVVQQLNASDADSQLHARLAGSVIYANPALRADARVLVRNRRGQSGLWGYGISGDLPIVLLCIAEASNIDLVRQLVQAHAYWRLKGLATDLVIWNEERGGYLQQLQEQIMGLITSGVEANVIDRPGGIFVRPAAQISSEDRVLLQSVARVIITDERGTLIEQLDRSETPARREPRFEPSRTQRAEPRPDERPAPRDLILENGLGGFARDGREYVVTLEPGEVTPAPWVNVLANPHFGSVVSESGGSYTWSDNAHEFRLTPWHNDPVGDSTGEAIYLRDEETGYVWSPTPSPARAPSTYVIRHGFGYTVFETIVFGIRTELRVYVALDAPVKFSVLRVWNESDRPRLLTATSYVEWVLGDRRERASMHVSTEIDPRTGALYARNPYNTGFADRVAFLDVDDPGRGVTGDRGEFLGRNGLLSAPAGLRRARLSGRVGAGFDPCGALQATLALAEGQNREVAFRLGVGRSADEASQLVQRFRGAQASRAALDAVDQHWRHTLGAVQVETPDPSLDILANGWLVYQTLACRVWARSGFYQSGGAFGFRDQLQDVMALVHTRPALLRDQLLLCASRQFIEGDVQHWWHPPSGRGVRTRCSDDYLWLPLALCRYVASTADTGVLNESVPFLEGRAVDPGDDSYYDLPSRSKDAATLYEHGVRAIRHGLRFGEHGLPLMGSGDWNDGMNLVGIKGRGESVWLGFFLSDVLSRFGRLARDRGDEAFAQVCRAEEERLRANIEEHGWDGAWYRRAYFDDGGMLGSAGNDECQIDSISQSWSVLSGVRDQRRSRMAMEAVDQRLVRRDDALIQLLDPPFDNGKLDPGYIRGYVPGVRENGGQYTHAAIWATMAFAALGDPERAFELMSLINPLNHARTPEQVATYKVEPYVVAADVYGEAPHEGRGGWTWYTGSAGWMYRLIVESLLGLVIEGERLRVAPCIPEAWAGFKARYRYRDTTYFITVAKGRVPEVGSAPPATVVVDGVSQADQTIPLVDDRLDHHVEVTM